MAHTAGMEYDPYLSIEVVNLSPFALTIAQIGIERRGLPREASLINPLMVDGHSLPRRMEARSSFTAYVPVSGSAGDLIEDSVRAYAKTDAGNRAYSKRRQSARVIRQLISLRTRPEAHGD
jgi:hypothetical protein